MRKGLIFSMILIFLVVGLTNSARSEESVIGKGTAERFNSVSKSFTDTEYILRYNSEEKTVDICLEDEGLDSNIYISLKDDQRAKLLNYLDKYQDWKKKAIDEGVKLEKEIGKFEATCAWDYNNARYGGKYSTGGSDARPEDVTTTFLSQNKKIHQFVIDFPEFHSQGNIYITEHPEQLYFYNAQAKILAKQLSNELAIQNALKKADKNKNVSEEFK